MRKVTSEVDSLLARCHAAIATIRAVNDLDDLDHTESANELADAFEKLENWITHTGRLPLTWR